MIRNGVFQNFETITNLLTLFSNKFGARRLESMDL